MGLITPRFFNNLANYRAVLVVLTEKDNRGQTNVVLRTRRLCIDFMMIISIFRCMNMKPAIRGFRTRKRKQLLHNILSIIIKLLFTYFILYLMSTYESLVKEDLPVDTARQEEKRKTTTIMKEPSDGLHEKQKHGRRYNIYT